MSLMFISSCRRAKSSFDFTENFLIDVAIIVNWMKGKKLTFVALEWLLKFATLLNFRTLHTICILLPTHNIILWILYATQLRVNLTIQPKHYKQSHLRATSYQIISRVCLQGKGRILLVFIVTDHAYNFLYYIQCRVMRTIINIIFWWFSWNATKFGHIFSPSFFRRCSFLSRCVP